METGRYFWHGFIHRRTIFMYLQHSPPFIYHLLTNVLSSSCTISFIDVPYWPPYSTNKFISCVVPGPPAVVLSLWWKDSNRIDSGENDDTWWYRTPSFFMTAQGVTPLLLSKISWAAGNGRFWNIHHTHPIWVYGYIMSLSKFHELVPVVDNKDPHRLHARLEQSPSESHLQNSEPLFFNVDFGRLPEPSHSFETSGLR